MPAQAQQVRLQLWDHVVGTAVTHNAILPAGTDVWIVTKPETRAVRLRDGYAEVLQGLRAARRDRLGSSGYTERTYPRTAAARQAYFVLARLPDGRLFQSYVRTGDAGWQPGFDAVQGGRISMGRVPEAQRGAFQQALEAPAPAAKAAVTPAANPAAEAAPAAPTPGDSAALDLPAFPDTSFLSDTTGAAFAPVPMQEADDDDLPPDPLETPAPSAAGRGLLWFLLGLAAGGAAAYFAAAAYYERLLRTQRENMLRYVPRPAEAEGAESAENGENL